MSEQEILKSRCLKHLRRLIKNIEEDTISRNYVFGFDVLEHESDYDSVKRRIRYSVERTEYFKKNK